MTTLSEPPRLARREVLVSVLTAPRIGTRDEGGSNARSRALALSVLVPTRNEAENVAPLLARLSGALTGFPCEVVFVDDSDDATPDVVEMLARDRHDQLEVRLLHRAPDERGDGLGGAVVAGLRQARGTWVCVMDGDLQHPPETIGAMLAAACARQADFVVASRYCDGGDAGGLASPSRHLASRAASGAASFLFRDALRPVSDPMSGFFLFRRSSVDVDCLRPRGFKILLEIAVRTPGLRITEVPFEFESRGAGESKADRREAVAYLRHLARLRVDVTRGRLVGRRVGRDHGARTGSLLESQPS